MPNPVYVFLILLVVIALIAGVAWLARRFFGSRLGTSANRGRMPRLAVIDAAAVDSRRNLVLVRRDNIEHLLMIGGPTDIVVETNIVRAQPTRDQVAPPRAVPAPEPSWQEPEMRSEPMDLGEPAPLPEPPPPRPVRTAFPDEPRRQPPPPPRPAEPRRPAPPQPADPFAGLTAELGAARTEPLPPPIPAREPAPVRAAQRSEPLAPRPQRAAEPPPLKAPPPVRAPERPQAPATAADQNLAEMAQRLEAALRRPAGDAKPEGDRAPPVAPEAPARAARPAAPEPAPAAENGSNGNASAPRAPFKNLEEEMASLLGRPKNPT